MNDERAACSHSVLTTATALGAVGALSFVDLAHGPARTLDVRAATSIYSGRWIARHGIPHHNTITVLDRAHQWIDIGWLGQIVAYGFWTGGGTPLVAGAFAALGALLLIFLGFLLLRGMRSLGLCVAGSLIGLAVVDRFLGPGTAPFGLAIGAVCFWLLTRMSVRDRIEHRTLIVLPLLALWCNVDPSALIGLGAVVVAAGVLALRAANRTDTKAALAAAGLVAAAYLATLVSPYGIHVLPELVREAGTGNLRAIVPGRSAPALSATADGTWWAWTGLLGVVGIAALAAACRLGPTKRPPLGPVVTLLVIASGAVAGSMRRDLEPWSVVSVLCILGAVTRPVVLRGRARPLAVAVSATVVTGLLWMVRRSWFGFHESGWLTVWSALGLIALTVVLGKALRPAQSIDDISSRETSRFRLGATVPQSAVVVLAVIVVVRTLITLGGAHPIEPGVDRTLVRALTANHHAGQTVLAPIPIVSSLLLHDPSFEGHVLVDSRVEVYRAAELADALGVVQTGSAGAANTSATLIVIAQANTPAFLALEQSGKWAPHAAGRWIVLTRNAARSAS